MWPYTSTSSPSLTGVCPMIRDSWEEREKFCQNSFFEVVTRILWYSMFFRKTLPPTHHVIRFHLPPSIFLVAPFPFFLWLVHWYPFFFSCLPSPFFKCAYVYKDNRANVPKVKAWWLGQNISLSGKRLRKRVQSLLAHQWETVLWQPCSGVDSGDFC